MLGWTSCVRAFVWFNFCIDLGEAGVDLLFPGFCMVQLLHKLSAKHNCPFSGPKALFL